MKTIKFFVSGIHCKACKMLIEDRLSELGKFGRIEVKLRTKELFIEVENDLTNEKAEQIVRSVLAEHNYQISTEKVANNHKDLLLAVPLAALMLLGFYVLQKSQLLDVNLGSVVNWKTAFLIGLIASVSSCLALVGGLVLSLSAKASEDGVKRSRLISFHASRLISFAIFGAALGYLGESIQINYTLGSVLGLASGLIMLILGLNMSGISSWSPTLPAGISRYFMRFERSRFAPLSLGAISFFLPCGFTQSMQFAAILSGSATRGAVIMLAFALGTLPILSLVSFGGYEISHNKKLGVLLKTMGLVILGLGLFSLTISLWGLGLFI